GESARLVIVGPEEGSQRFPALWLAAQGQIGEYCQPLAPADRQILSVFLQPGSAEKVELEPTHLLVIWLTPREPVHDRFCRNKKVGYRTKTLYTESRRLASRGAQDRRARQQ